MRIRCMLNILSSDQTSEEETHWFGTVTKRKLTGAERVSRNSLISANHPSKPSKTKISTHFQRRTNTIITQFSHKSKMSFRAMNNLKRKTRQSVMSIDSTRPTDKMFKFHISSPMKNGLSHPKMCQSLLRQLMISRDTMDKDTALRNLWLQLGSIF